MLDDQLPASSLPELRAQLERHQQRESELLALHETARDLTALRDVDRVLQAIVRRARQLLSADVGYLSVYDAERRDFYIRATEGSVSPAFARIRVPLDVGICGLVAAEKIPHFSSAYATDERFRHSGGIDHGVLAEQIESLLGVPLLADDAVIGVLFVADRYQRAYSASQVALLDSLGAHASAAMENARLFQEAREALARERETNARLQERTREIQSAADVHEQLTSLLASGGDLDAFAAVVAHHLDGRAVVVDGTLTALGDSAAGAGDGDGAARDGETGNGDGAAPLDPRLREALERSSQLGRSVRCEQPAAWVAAAGDPSGAPGGLVLWRAAELTQPQVRTLERAAVMVALMLLVRERVAVAEQRALGDLIGGLLKHPQGDRATLAREARRRGLPLDGPLCVVAARTERPPDAQTAQAARAALLGDALVGLFDGELVAIARAEHGAEAAQRLHAALGAAGASDRGARGAGATHTPTISYATAADLTELPGAHQRARQSVELLLGLGRAGALAPEATLAPYALLLSERGRGDAQQFVEAQIGPLIAWDARRSTDLTRTLLTYFDCAHSTSATAAVLHVHPNTLRQRLDRVTALLPGWAQAERMLELHLALRLHAIRDRVAPA
jgi:GAF domain-containing protein